MKKIFTILGLVSATTIMFAQTNLVQNPGFESGLDNWTAGFGSSYTLPTVVTGGAHGGNNFANYVATATTGFYQEIPGVTPGKTYVVSFWYKASGDDSDARIWSNWKSGTTIVYQNGASSAAGDVLRGPDNGYLTTATEWTQYSVEVVAPASVDLFQFAVRAYNGGNASFDDFVFQDKATMAVSDVNAFDKAVKMNTIVGNELKLILPGKATVNIYSADGRLVSSNRVDNGQAINTSSMAKGNYIVTVDNGSAKVSRKVIKN